ncbi:MAG: histidine phosphatase family protein [Bacteroidota bacterium]
MYLFVLRHGEAAPAPLGARDRDRTLTPRGEADIAALARWMASLSAGLTHLGCSPYVRTRQTADLLGATLGLQPQPDRLLQAGASTDDVREVVHQLDVPDVACLVIHQPTIGQLVYDLTGSRAALPPGTLAVLEASDQRLKRAHLVALLPPGLVPPA